MLGRRELLVAGLGAVAGLGLGSRSCAGVRVWRDGGLSDELTDETPRALVLLQLSGGNDGLDTIVPWADGAYRAARPKLGRAAKDVLRIDDYRGFHPSLSKLRALFDDGGLAIVEGVGYPNPNRSHFKSLDIWHAANTVGRNAGEGWIGRLCSALYGTQADPNRVVHVGRSVPYSLHSTVHPPACFGNPAAYRWVKDGRLRDYEAPVERGESSLDFVRTVLDDARQSSLAIRRAAAAYRSKTEYPSGKLADGLRVAAAVLHGRVGARVISVEQGGYDTHTSQRGTRDGLLEDLDGSIAAFLEDIAGTSVGENVLVFAFSEFGRRVSENGSGGTDHGTAGPSFLCGAPVRGGLYGKHPSLAKLDDNADLRFTTDFRSIYATIIEDWFGAKSKDVLGERFGKLDCLKA